MQSMMHAKYPKQLKLTTHNLNRLLSWAAHVFAYDLAYEPEGWPWRPVSHIKYCLLSFVQGVQKTHFQNAVGATVHWFNHK